MPCWVLRCALGQYSETNSYQSPLKIEFWTKADSYKNDVHVLLKHLDEKVAALHLDKLGVKLTEKQTSYIGVPTEGPFKPDHYRY